MSAASVGPAIGKAWMLGEGMATVFASDSQTHLTVQIDKSGRRYWMPRKTIKWRSSPQTERSAA